MVVLDDQWITEDKDGFVYERIQKVRNFEWTVGALRIHFSFASRSTQMAASSPTGEGLMVIIMYSMKHRDQFAQVEHIFMRVKEAVGDRPLPPVVR
jgi:hypothetical protein